MTAAVPERISVTIDAPGAGAPLAADDALRQLLDVFDLLAAAGGNDASPVIWKLVDISKKNPVTIVAEAVSKVPGFPAGEIARREKRLVLDAISDLTLSRPVPRWMDKTARQRAQSLFQRNTEGIGLTTIALSEDAGEPKTTIVEKNARIAIATIESHERALAESISDKSRVEIGVIDGYVGGTQDYRGRPSLRIRDSFSDTEITCVLTEEVLDTFGNETNLNTALKHARVIVRGEIKYGRDGSIERVSAFDVRRIEAANPFADADIADPNFTGGLSPFEYISAVRRIDGA